MIKTVLQRNFSSALPERTFMLNRYVFCLGILAMLAGSPLHALPATRAAPAASYLRLMSSQAGDAGQAGDALRRDLRAAKARVYPALVNISVVYRYFADGRAQRNLAGGSGVIVTKDGYVITNYHVAENTTHIVCTLTTGEAIEADDIADDPLSDLSVLKLRLGDRSRRTPLPYATLGDSDKLSVGDFVLAMGNPLMLSSSMTLGIVANTKRVFTDFTGTQMEDMQLENGERTGVFTRWIQHDALILPGNSGGPLVNVQGEVVGINELGNNGEGFAIPSNIVAQVLRQVLQYGRVIRGTLGLTVMPVQKLGRSTGALISAVMPGFPAAKAGLRPGDIVLDIDNEPTNVQFFEEVPLLYQQIAGLPIGRRVSIRLLRSGVPFTLAATVAVMPRFLGEEDEFRTAGVTVRNLTPESALANHLPDTNGVVVTGVRPGYPFDSAEPNIQPGDVIRSVNGHAVPDIKALGKVLAKLDTATYSVSMLRSDENIIAVVKPNDDKDVDDGGELPQAWIGIKTQVMVPDLAKALGAGGQTGFRITEVYPWTEASKAGLRPGDIITALNGQVLDAAHPQDAEDFSQAVDDLSVGDKAKLTVLRGGTTKDIDVTLEPTPASASETKTAKDTVFEFDVREITLEDRAQNHWTKDQQGVLVTDVTPGSWAQVGGLHPDDLIVSINDKPVTGADNFKHVMAALVKAKPSVIQIFVRRDYQTQFVFIEPDWKKLMPSD
jgi:serine protease Do